MVDRISTRRRRNSGEHARPLPAAAGASPPNMAQVVLGGPPDEAAEFRGNGNLEWDLPTGVIWWDERMHVLLGAAVGYVAFGRKPARGEAPLAYRHDDVNAESLMAGVDRRSTRNN